MKRRLIRTGLFLGACVPYAFLGVNGDAAWGTMTFYGLMVLCQGLLCFAAIRTCSGGAVIAGGLCSLLLSYLLALGFRTDKWDWYFKPLTGEQLVTTVFLLSLGAQLLALRFFRRK